MSTLAIPEDTSGRSPIERAELRPRWVPDALFPFESRFVEVGGARLHYVDEGSGPALLLVHGSPMWSFMYRAVIRELRSRYRCIAVDLPGLGLSTAPFVRGRAFAHNAEWLGGFIDRVGIESPTLVLHATAGPSALQMALSRKERIRALVISNSFAWPLDGDRKLDIITRVIGSRPFAFANVHGNLLGWLTSRFGRRVGRFSRLERRAIGGPFRTKAVRRHLQNLLYGVRAERAFLASLESRLHELAEIPTLFLYGARDNGYAAGFLDRFESILVRHEAVVLPHSGHFPLEDEPEQFIDAMRSWLSRHVDE